MKKNDLTRMTLSAMFLALGLVLPFLTGQIPQIGSMLAPMHIPALLCGFVCGWQLGLAAGFIMPLLRFVLFGMPPLYTAAAMAFELAVYGAAAGILYQALPKKPVFIYISLLLSMLLGRAVWGLVSIRLYALQGLDAFTLNVFWTRAFVQALPGIALQILLIPAIVYALQRAKLIPLKQ